MEQHLIKVFSQSAYLILLGTTAIALFFFMAAIRELQSRHLDGLLFLALAVFFTVAHFVYLGSLPSASPIQPGEGSLGFWQWLNLFFAPALIGLFLLFGIYRLIANAPYAGLVKVFLGLTLLCYLYMVGADWPVDVKGILALLYCGAWFELGLRTAS